MPQNQRCSAIQRRCHERSHITGFALEDSRRGNKITICRWLYRDVLTSEVVNASRGGLKRDTSLERERRLDIFLVGAGLQPKKGCHHEQAPENTALHSHHHPFAGIALGSI